MRTDRGSARALAVTLAAASLSLFLPLALAACGGSGDDAAKPDAATSQAAASPSPSWSPTMQPATIPKVEPGEKLPPFKQLTAMFAYDTSQPLEYESQPGESQSGCTVETISFTYGDKNNASGYLVTPDGEGPFPVVIYAPGWRTDVVGFLSHAVTLAKKGYAGLLLQEAPSLVCWTLDPETDCRGVIENVTQERRGMDLLETMPQIDMTRVGFVGWSNGAHLLGGVMTGVDPRVKAYALIGMARPTSNYRIWDDSKGKAWERTSAQLALWDPVNYLGHNRGSAFLFINGEDDPNAMQDAPEFMKAAPKPKTWKVYDGGHSPTPEAYKYILAWLQKNL